LTPNEVVGSANDNRELGSL